MDRNDPSRWDDLSDTEEAALEEKYRLSLWIGSVEFDNESPTHAEQRMHTLHRAVEIDDAKYFGIQQAIDEANHYLFREEHGVVRANFENYVQAVEDTARVLQDERPSPFTLRQQNTMLRIWLFDWLISVRAFLDFSTTRLTRRYGTKSSELREFARNCSKEFDDHFSYRFMYKLRDYAQHCGFPPVRLSQREGVRRAIIVALEFDRDLLLREFSNWGSQVTSDLRSQPLRFPAEDHVTTMMQSIDRLDSILKAIERPRYEENLDTIRKVAKLASRNPGVPTAFAQVEEKASGNLVEMQYLTVPTWLLSTIADTEKKPAR